MTSPYFLMCPFFIFLDNLKFQDLSYLAFEMQDKSLWDLMKERESGCHWLSTTCGIWIPEGYWHNSYRSKTWQHHACQPQRPALQGETNWLCFCPSMFKVKVGMTMQAYGYRVLEVTLCLCISEDINMWELGCVPQLLERTLGSISAGSPSIQDGY